VCRSERVGISKKQRELDRKSWRNIDALLFKGQQHLQVDDAGDNWAKQFHDAMSIPEDSEMNVAYKQSMLASLNRDFEATATYYGKAIISEYFLHDYMRTITPQKLGGVAGGEKFLWRGILFKLADGSSGPWNGNDEAAAKAAGHELKNTCRYAECNIEGLNFAPMILIDYRGFRLVAQAMLPLGPNTLKSGSCDGGRTVHADDKDLLIRLRLAAERLCLREHIVGDGVSLPCAADVEGHHGLDGRLYVLDLARAFPPEDPRLTPHLDGILLEGTHVYSITDDCEGRVVKACKGLHEYDIVFPDGTVVTRPATHLRNQRRSVFYRLLRPEFVRDRGKSLRQRLPAYRLPETLNPLEVPSQDGHKEREAKSSGSTLQLQQEVSCGSAPSLEAGGACYDYCNSADSVSLGAAYACFGGYSYASVYGEFSSGVPITPRGSSYEQEGYTTFPLAPPGETGLRDPAQEEYSTAGQAAIDAVPLSPDALTAFSRADPKAEIWNREVAEATDLLMRSVIPGLAQELCHLSPTALAELRVSAFIHAYGVNCRHLGLVRACIPVQAEGSATAAQVRELLLLEIVARTIKQLVRDYQRRWMRAQRSTSSSGICMVLLQVLNLVSGSHASTEAFWSNNVKNGLMARFGAVALTEEERADLAKACRPKILKGVLETLISMVGIKLAESSLNAMRQKADLRGFSFVLADIADVVPVVTSRA
ncbi:unnamed protein product, partial [Chrysoparadoxa australica]